MNGRSAAPAWVAEYPWTWTRFIGKEEHEAGERGIEKKREQVGARERPRPEQPERKHRRRGTRFENEKGEQQDNPGDGSQRNGFNQPEDQRAEPGRRQRDAGPIEPDAPGRRDSGTRQIEIASTMTAIGRLMKKIQRHDRCSMSQPPSTGPSAAVMAVNPAQVRIARPRCAGNVALMSERLPGTRNAAPMP